MARGIVGPESFREIFVDCSARECERRDVKGFYSKARRGEISGYTGVSSDYEPPTQPDCAICTEGAAVEDSVRQLFHYIKAHTNR